MVVQALADLKAPKRLAVIGCGNPNRSDDGVGSHVMAALAAKTLREGVEIFDAGTDGMSVLYRARGATHLIIVDARVPGDAPGAVFEPPSQLLLAEPRHSLNLHDFRWDHALYVGRRIYAADFPMRLRVFLVEAQSLALGVGLSDPVARAADIVCSRILSLMQEFAEGTWA